MTDEEHDELERLLAAEDEPWDDDRVCPGCGQSVTLASPDFEPRGLCMLCTQRLITFVPKLVDEAAGSRRRPYKPDVIRVERGDYVRVCGLTICVTCGCELYDHAPVTGYAFLRRRCDGVFVKL